MTTTANTTATTSTPTKTGGDAAAALRVLTPAERALPGWPRWTFVALVTALALNAVHNLSELAFFDAVAGCADAVAIVAVCVLASRLEERMYRGLIARSIAIRLGAALFMGPAGLMSFVVACALLTTLPRALGFSDWLVAVGCIGGLWWLGAVAGSAPIVIIDVVISALIPGFRRRVQLAVLSLLVLLVGTSSVIAAGGVEVLARIASAPTEKLATRLTLDNAPFTVDEMHARVLELLAHPGAVVLATLGFALVLGLPALWSATGKLADAVMERIVPLSRAFDEVAQGKRDVRVEEGGSTELLEMTKRFNAMLEALALAERMERAFGVYVSSQVLERIRAQHGDAALPPALREASVFFADIRGFTNMSEKLTPVQVVDVLNRYFARIVPVIEKHGGYLNKFVGDAVVVVFNGPVDQPDHAERATRCALALQSEVALMNGEGAFPELKGADVAGVLRVGVGVATGPMVCGNIGSARQMEYTVIGDTVNLSARLTGQAKAGDVVVSEATAKLLAAPFATTPLELIKVKGKELEVRPYLALLA